jgi:hypothetical protein
LETRGRFWSFYFPTTFVILNLGGRNFAFLQVKKIAKSTLSATLRFVVILTGFLFLMNEVASLPLHTSSSGTEEITHFGSQSSLLTSTSHLGK